MSLSERQGTILNMVVQDYISTAEPISSDFLKRKYGLELSSASIRIEMQKLTDMGYLSQPHTSSGRVPTDRGYRFFVDYLIESRIEELINNRIIREINRIDREIKDRLMFLQELNRFLASASSGLTISYLSENKIFLKEGWKNLFSDPEFSNSNYIKDFFSVVEYLEENIDSFGIEDDPFQIYIGEESPIPKSNEFSILISKCKLYEGQDGILAILGPKRMAYDKNIFLINSIIKSLNNKSL